MKAWGAKQRAKAKLLFSLPKGGGINAKGRQLHYDFHRHHVAGNPHTNVVYDVLRFLGLTLRLGKVCSLTCLELPTIQVITKAYLPKQKHNERNTEWTNIHYPRYAKRCHSSCSVHSYEITRSKIKYIKNGRKGTEHQEIDLPNTTIVRWQTSEQRSMEIQIRGL